MAGASYRFEWDCSTLTAGTFDATDGGTVVIASEGTPSHTITDGVISLSANTYARIPASDGNNINLSGGKITITDYTVNGGTTTSSTEIVSCGYSTATGQFNLQRSTSDTYLRLRISGASYYITTSENVFSGSHDVELSWDCAAKTYSLKIDSSTYSGALSSTTVPNPDQDYVYINGFNNVSSPLAVSFSNVTIE